MKPEDVSAQGETPEVETPEVESPEVETPEVESPEVESLEDLLDAIEEPELSGRPEPGSLEAELEDLEAAMQHDIADVLAERDQFKDIAQRLQADFDNYRKRAASQLAEEVDRATGRLAQAFLPVLDAAEAAYLRNPEEVGPLLNVMLSELKKQGLETLDLDGQPFDPEVAEAVAHESGEGGDVTVAEVLRSGYRWKGKTLRAAMVRTRD
jgi:molecular chaperone GrpE